MLKLLLLLPLLFLIVLFLLLFLLPLLIVLVLTRLVVRRRERRVREHKEQEEKTEVEISENEIHSQLISPVAVIIDSCVSVSVNPDSDNRVEKLEMFKAPSADELSHPSSSCALFSDSSSDSASDCEYPYKDAYPGAPSELI